MIYLDSLRTYDNSFASLKTRGIKCSYRLRAPNYLTITSIRCRSVFRETHAYSSVFSRKSAGKKVHKDVPCPPSGTVLYTMRTVDDKFRKLLTQTADLRLYSYLRIHLNVKIPYVCVCVCIHVTSLRLMLQSFCMHVWNPQACGKFRQSRSWFYVPNNISWRV